MVKKIDWVLMIILVMALVIRVMQFRNGVQWNNVDVMRDMLVAKHINLYGEYPLRGPTAAGGYGVLLNSTLYYYFWAVVWKIIPTEIVMPIVMTVVGMGIIILCNLIGKIMLSKYSRYLWLIIVALSPEMIRASVDPSQPKMIILFGLLVIFGLTKYYKTGNILWLLWSVLGNWLGLEIHYSIFALYPIFIMFFLVSSVKWKNKFGKNISWLVVLFAWLASLFVWITTTFKNVWGDQINFILVFLNKSDFNIKGISEGVVRVTKFLIIDLIGFEVKMNWIIGTIVISLLTVGIVRWIKRKDWWLLAFGVGLGLGELLVATQLSFLPSSVEYIKLYFVLFPLLLIYFFETTILSKKVIKMAAIGLSIAAIYFSWKVNNWKYVTSGDNEVVNHITNVIYDDALLNFKDNKMSFNIWNDNDNQLYDFSSVIFWYWLEKKMGRQLVRLDVYNGNVFYPLNNTENRGYLICLNWGGFMNMKNCPELFLKNYPAKYKLALIDKNISDRKTEWFIYRVNTK